MGFLGFKKTGGFFGFLEKPLGFDALIAIFTVSLSPARAHARVRYVYSIRGVYIRMPLVIFYSKIIIRFILSIFLFISEEFSISIIFIACKQIPRF